MDIYDVGPGYFKEGRIFFRSPLAFIRQFDVQAPEQGKRSLAYIIVAFFLTSALVLVQLRLIPLEVSGPRPKVEKAEIVFSYGVQIVIFSIFLCLGSWALSGMGKFKSNLIGIIRIYSFLVPTTTLMLILVSQMIGFAISTYWLVTPPLGIIGFEPVARTTTNLLLLAALATVYFYLALFFLLCTIWMLGTVHQFSYYRACIATVASIAGMVWINPHVIRGVRKVYEVFEPFIAIFFGT